jgi:hypothetical protein
MADYLSQYTGQQVDAAIGIALGVVNTLTDYVKKDEINISIPGLTDGKLSGNQLPYATTNVAGGIKVGDGLVISQNGVLSVSTTMYYNQSEVDHLLSQKASQDSVDELAERIMDTNNYSITIQEASEQDPSSLQVYYQLAVK